MATRWNELIVLTLALSSSYILQVEGKKVLMLSMQMGGHLGEFGTIASELLKMDDYEIHVVMDENIKTPPQLNINGLKVLHYKSPDKSKVDIKAFDRECSELAFQTSDPTPIHHITVPRLTLDCRLLLQDKELYKKFEAERYDAALVDGMINCYHLIPYRLGIPIISLSTLRRPLITRTFPLTSGASCAAPPKNILERISLISEARFLESVPSIEIDETEFLDFLPGKKLKSLQEVAETTMLWILPQGNILDCPRPSMPNVVYVGGLNTKPPKPIKGDLLEFANSAIDGLIVVSFGSMFSTQPKNFIQKFVTAFKQIPQKIVWRVSKDSLADLEVSENVKRVDWLPQNDILGHNNTRLFITHCGNNGQWEGFYNGVPMIGMPVWGDQIVNADRLLYHEIGLKLDTWSFTVDDLVATIKRVINNDKYRKNLKRLTEIFKSLPEHPSVTAAYWVDHVIKYGADHLKTAAFELSVFEFYMLDLYAFLTFVLMTVFMVFRWFCTFIINRYRKVEDRTKKMQ